MKRAIADFKRRLRQETARRIAAEGALEESEQHHFKSLEQARHLQEQMRRLSHQLLTVQEDERKRISRELHDEVVQTLTGITVQLANLKTAATLNTSGLQKKISSTQRLVEKSVEIVHRFARDLRPTLLDDLGLVPALHSFLKDFTRRTRLRIQFTAFTSAPIQELDNAKRTAFYRVVQEALTNVARHAQASQVAVTLKKLASSIHLEIVDDGKGFAVDGAQSAKRHNRLGVVGMRERVQMVGGEFSLSSVPGRGTTVRVEIPLTKRRQARKHNRK